MVKQILTSAGFVEGKTFKETRFLVPPKKTYAIYNDSIERLGADDKAFAYMHDVTIEVYEYAPDLNAEISLEKSLDSYLKDMTESWSKQSRFWVQEEQLYQIVYEISYITKGN